MDIQPLEKGRKRQTKSRGKDQSPVYRADLMDAVVTEERNPAQEADPYIQLLLHEGESSMFDLHETSPALQQPLAEKMRKKHVPQVQPQNIDWFNPWNRRALSAQANVTGDQVASKKSIKKATIMNLTLPDRHPSPQGEHAADKHLSRDKKSKDSGTHLRKPTHKPSVLLQKSTEQPSSDAGKSFLLTANNKQSQSLPPKPQAVPPWASQTIHQMIWPMNTQVNLEMYMKAKQTHKPTSFQPKRINESKEEQKEKQLRKIIKDKVNKNNYYLFNRNPYFTGALKRMMIREMDARKLTAQSNQSGNRSLLWDASKNGFVNRKSSDYFTHTAATVFKQDSRSGSEPARVRVSHLTEPFVPQKYHQTTLNLTRPGVAFVDFSKKPDHCEDYEAKYPYKSKKRSTADHFFITKTKLSRKPQQKQSSLNQIRS